MNKSDSIYIAGHRGLVGSAMHRRLQAAGYGNLITRTHAALDLTNQAAVNVFFRQERPAYVLLAAARVGGIYANDIYPADFIRDNLQIQANVIDAAYRNGVRKLCFLGSSCIYPRQALQPMTEGCLMTGPLEPTNEWYAIAKIAGIKLCQAYRKQYGFNAIALMPTNLYGPADNFNLTSSHVLPAFIRRFHEAKKHGHQEVVIWGTGTPRREFLYVEDLADAALFLMQMYHGGDIVNVGVGKDISIAELADLTADIVGYNGKIVYDATKPDGTPRKLLDTTKLNRMGWQPKTPLREGIFTTYQWFLTHQEELRL